jgi:hypothetical protein
MAGFTPWYRLAYFDFGDKLREPINVDHEINRFLTIDSQVYGLYQVFGSGVIDGWEIFDAGYSQLDGIKLGVSAGTGIVRSIAGETFGPKIIASVPPNTSFNVYAVIRRELSSAREVDFVISTTELGGNAIKLASVISGSNSINVVNNEDRQFLPFEQSIQDALDSHKHRGTPSKIDLTKEVKNQLHGSRIHDIPSDKIANGKLDPKVYAPIAHADLLGAGALTHGQVDSFVTSLADQSNRELLGEQALSNHMRQTLFLKYKFADVDETLQNNINLIPGISPNSYIDFVNSTATIDLDLQCIVGAVKRNQPEYFYTTNFVLPARPVSGQLTSVHSTTGTITFGVNNENSVDFDGDYTTISTDKVFSFPESASSNLRVGIKLNNTSERIGLDYPDTFGDYMTPIFNNVVDFDFENTGAPATFHFKILFYSDVDLTTLIYTADTSSDTEGWSYGESDGDQFVFPGGGLALGTSVSRQILWDPTGVDELDCGDIYYVEIQYDDGGGFDTFSDTDLFTIFCESSFTDYVDFSFTNDTGVDKDLHFRLRFYEDNERTNSGLVHTEFSLNTPSGWVIDDDDTIPSGGFPVTNGNSVNVVKFPDLSNFQVGTLYFLSIDAWDGSDFISEVNDYTFSVENTNSSCDRFAGLPHVKNFSITFTMEDDTKVLINVSS